MKRKNITFILVLSLILTSCDFSFIQLTNTTDYSNSTDESSYSIPSSLFESSADSYSGSTSNSISIEPSINSSITNSTQSESQEIRNITYYGREILNQKENLKNLYDLINTSIGNVNEQIDISYLGINELSSDDLSLVFDLYRRDHPEHFWFTGNYTITSSGSKIISVTPKYSFTSKELSSAQELFNKKAIELKNLALNAKTEFDKELVIHDFFCKNVRYVEGDNAHNSYGPIVEGKGVCEGYAKAFQYILNLIGIDCFIINGSSFNPVTNQMEGHAWNAVKINNIFYHVDLTWDDQYNKETDNLYYSYFNVSDEIIKKDHEIEEVNYQLPSCDSMKDNYFTINGGLIETLDKNEIAKKLREDNLTSRFYMSSNVTTSEFINYCKSELSSIANMAGVTTSCSGSFSSLGNEVIFKIYKM